MIDKKIIINKIDVTECAYRRQNPHNFCMCASVKNESGNIIEPTRYVQCEHNPDCYFKQLKRKEQECEELKEWQEANQPTGICETCTAKSVDDMYRYKQALDEIRRYRVAEINDKDEEENDTILCIIDEVKEQNNRA